MLRKLTVVLAAAVFGITAAISVPAEAQHHNESVTVNRNVNVNRTVNVNRNVRINRNINVNRNLNVNRRVNVDRRVRSNFVVGRRYNGHMWFGHNRHFWHGRWHAYGDGPCWINVGEWFWNELVCPL
jgi:hypothetical protein